MITVLLIVLSVFFSMNMGVSGFSVAFAPSYGSRLITKNRAALFYFFFVLAGGLLLGPRVAATLTKGLTSSGIVPLSGVLILSASGMTLFVSNLLRIPQSTSFVTVASFLGAGLRRGEVHWPTVTKIALVAAVFSAISFGLTFWLIKKIYPPRRSNLKFYEYFGARQGFFKKFILGHDLYSAFGIGTNNVANVVAPLVASFKAPLGLVLGLGAVFFGLGARFFGGRVINTVSRDIVPIGDISASIVSLMTASLVIAASLLGLPAPYVQFTTFAVLAISCAKDGARQTAQKAIFRRIIFVWILVPLAAVLLSYLLHRIFL